MNSITNNELTSISPHIDIQITNVSKKELVSKPKWWQYFMAGEIAGLCGLLICHPFDTAKTKAQMLSTHNQSTISFMRSIILKNGLTSVYHGIAYPFFGFGVLFAISFGVNGIVRNHYIRKNENDMDRFNKYNLKPSELSRYQLVIGGIFAGAASSVFRTPIERVKVWSQIHHTNTAKSTVDLITRYGFLKGFWYGFGPTLGREVPQFAVYYPIYEATCSLLSDPELHGDKTKIEGWKIFLSGASAGVGCWILTYPIDVIKTRVQAAPPNTYKNVIDVTTHLYKQGGYRIFWN
eukprot:848353_1